MEQLTKQRNYIYKVECVSDVICETINIFHTPIKKMRVYIPYVFSY